ncbi:MAG: 2,4'-dihydroxyacetophenone dioxygenase family protein [Alcanivorax nanhaiticus]
MSMLPMLVKDHDELLTLNNNEMPIYKDIMVPGLDVQPQYVDVNRGIWVLRVMFHPGVRLPMHYHTGTVHLWTLSGKWNYIEYPDQPQTAGCYLFEPGGSIHTFNVPADNTEVTDTLMLVEGANVNFDENGQYHSMLDANSITLLIEQYIQENGMEPATYIKPSMPDYAKNIKG